MDKNVNAIIALIIVVILAILFTPWLTAFTVKDLDGNAIIARLVSPGDNITVTYIHSVEKMLVTEGYVVGEGSTLVLSYGTFSSFYAGLPSDVSNNITYTEDGLFLRANINETFEDVKMRITASQQPEIAVNGLKYPVYSMVSDGSLITLKLEKISPVFLVISWF